MVHIVCPRCRQVFDRETNYRRHEARKNPCEPAAGAEAPDSEKLCGGCGKTFSTKGSRDRHHKTGACPANPARLRIRELENELAALRVGNLPALSHCGPIIHNTLNSTTLNTNTINITVQAGARSVSQRSFGDENIEHINEEWLRNMLQSIPLHLPAKEAGGLAIRKTMEGIWADGDHPENLTVIFTSARKDPLILDKGVWRSAPMAEIQAHMQSKAVDIVTSGPITQPTDNDVFSAIREDEQNNTYLLTARSTMQNARIEIQRTQGNIPILGDEVPVIEG